MAGLTEWSLICDRAVQIILLERNVLFNDALNTFYLRLYGVRHMVKDHSDSEKGNPLPPHRLLLSINSKVLLYAPSHRQDNTYHGLCYTSRGALAGTRNSSMVILLSGMDILVDVMFVLLAGDEANPKQTWQQSLSFQEGGVLFNDALNTFYLRLYGVGHKVKDPSDSERGNPMPPHGLLFPIDSKGSFICTIPQSWSTGCNEK